MKNLSFTKDRISVITLNRPPANALSQAMIQDLSAALDELEKDDNVQVILIHGEGKFFSAGADIKEFTTFTEAKEFSQLARNGQKLFDRVEAFPKPIIAAIHGAALGGGLELAMACHIRYVTEDAKLGLPELQLGLIPGFAGTQRLPRYVGTAKAAEMMFTSEPITGNEAVALGLANRALSNEDLLPKAKELAEKIAAKSTVTTKFVLELLTYAKSDKFQQGVEKEAEFFGKAFASHDGQEGIRAFIEKRKPNFQNK